MGCDFKGLLYLLSAGPGNRPHQGLIEWIDHVDSMAGVAIDPITRDTHFFVYRVHVVEVDSVVFALRSSLIMTHSSLR